MTEHVEWFQGWLSRFTSKSGRIHIWEKVMPLSAASLKLVFKPYFFSFITAGEKTKEICNV